MPPKRATFYSYGNDVTCNDVKQIIEDAGYILNVRDIEKSPFSYDELNRIIGHIDLKHFINNIEFSS